MPSTFSTTDARVASILSRYSLASQRRLASTVSSSSSSSSSLESSLFPDSKLSSPSSDSTSSPSRTSVVQHRRQGLRWCNIIVIAIQVFETTTRFDRGREIDNSSTILPHTHRFSAGVSSLTVSFHVTTTM
jgi:hypothetical protein